MKPRPSAGVSRIGGRRHMGMDASAPRPVTSCRAAPCWRERSSGSSFRSSPCSNEEQVSFPCSYVLRPLGNAGVGRAAPTPHQHPPARCVPAHSHRRRDHALTMAQPWAKTGRCDLSRARRWDLLQSTGLETSRPGITASASPRLSPDFPPHGHRLPRPVSRPTRPR